MKSNQVASETAPKDRTSKTRLHHKTALNIVREFDAIAVENLNVAGLLKNHHLAKTIIDVAWGAFFLILMSKAASAGRLLVKIPEDLQRTRRPQRRCRTHATIRPKSAGR